MLDCQAIYKLKRLELTATEIIPQTKQTFWLYLARRQTNQYVLNADRGASKSVFLISVQNVVIIAS